MSKASRWRFRAWCDEHGMVLAEFHHLHGMDATCTKHDCYTSCTIMQSTGLMDKNGVEIFEGDVVLVRSTYDDENPIECAAKVYWSDGKYRCDYHGMVLGKGVCSGEDSNWSMEVIGNIYENPELLEGKQ